MVGSCRGVGHLSQPSPSLGPPLLSESWSPPLFCGMLQTVVDPPPGEGAVVTGPPEPPGGVTLDGLELLHAPSMNRAATAATQPPWKSRFVTPTGRRGLVAIGDEPAEVRDF